MNYNIKPINFKFGEYISQGIDAFKKDIGDYIIACLLTMVLSIIPLCNLMAIGNFFKFCRSKREGKNPSTGSIFNFDDFVTYLVLQLILIGSAIVISIPMFLFGGFSAYLAEGGNETSAAFGGIFMIIYQFAFLAVVFYFFIKAFYMIGLISLEGITDFKTAWKMSKEMTNGNFLNILLFSIIVSFIGQLGAIACIIGVILTIPASYLIQYFAIEDGIQQIKHDEVQEIGQA